MLLLFLGLHNYIRFKPLDIKYFCALLIIVHILLCMPSTCITWYLFFTICSKLLSRMQLSDRIVNSLLVHVLKTLSDYCTLYVL